MKYEINSDCVEDIDDHNDDDNNIVFLVSAETESETETEYTVSVKIETSKRFDNVHHMAI